LIQLQRNGNWVTEKDVTINGKTTSQFLASVILDNLPPRPFNIRMVRETADSTTDQLQNRTLWSSYTEIIDVKQCYPNTAIVGLQVDAEQFGGQQMTVNYHIRGRIIQVPSNYDPEKRTYSGIWDGSLKPAYSNNPAWCLWDMLTHPRYGMGKRLGAADVDKWALYAIVTLPETGAATVNLINGSGKPVSVDITAHPAPDRIQVSTLPDGVETYGVWGLSLPSLRRRLFRCVSVRENTDGTFAITAVDNGARFEPQSGSLNSVIPPAVQHLTVEVSAADGQYLAQAKWDTPRVVKGVRFSLRLTSGKGTDARLVTTAITADTEHRFSGLPLGEYTLTVRAINSYGQQGEPATTTFRIAAPAAPSRIELTPGYFQITA
ncbi:host specificity protein J, partial [Escherichia coli]